MMSGVAHLMTPDIANWVSVCAARHLRLFGSGVFTAAEAPKLQEYWPDFGRAALSQGLCGEIGIFEGRKVRVGGALRLFGCSVDFQFWGGRWLREIR